MTESTEINTCQTQAKINAIRYTSDRRHAVAATSDGFKIIDAATGEVKKACKAFKSGLNICAPFGNTSIFFIVGTGAGTEELRTSLIIWDDAKQKKVGTITFKHAIVDVRTEGSQYVILQLAGQPDLLVFDAEIGFNEAITKVSLPSTMVAESDKFQEDVAYASANNHKRWCWTSTCHEKQLLIARPDETCLGNILVTQVKEQKSVEISYRVTNGYPIDSLMLCNSDGKVALALSYLQGTYLRVFHLGKEAQLMKEVKRSRTSTNIYSMNLHTENDTTRLICSSDAINKTVHLFDIPVMKPQAVADEGEMLIPLLQGLEISAENMPAAPGYLSSTQTSFAKIYPSSTDFLFTIATIISGEQVSVITSDGNQFLANLADGKLIEGSEKNFMA